MVKIKHEEAIKWAMRQMERSDIMLDTEDIRDILMHQKYRIAQANDIIRAARKRSGRFFGKTAYTNKYGLTYK